MKLADFPNVEALSPREKLQLVDEICVSLAEELEDVEVSPEEKRMLDERWAAFERSPESALTLDQFKARVAARRK